MTLIDTSVWVDHFRRSDALLQDLLNEGEVLIHPFVIGELACGNLNQREAILDSLNALPHVAQATHEEVTHLMESKRLYGKGLGWIDAHLIASAMIGKIDFWTKDKRLASVAKSLRLQI